LEDVLFLIGIAGGSGSGKTTFAHKLQDQSLAPLSVLHMDSYYLPFDEIPEGLRRGERKANFDHPSAFDWELLQNHISSLKQGNSIEVPNYDFKTSSRLNTTTTLQPQKVLLLEGIFAIFDRFIRDCFDVKVYLHVEADIRFTRRLHRDTQTRGRSVDSVTDQYYATVRPMYKEFLEPQKEYADIIVGEETDVASNILAAKINEFFYREQIAINSHQVQENLQ
jgi:uridine kinase